MPMLLSQHRQEQPFETHGWYLPCLVAMVAQLCQDYTVSNWFYHLSIAISSNNRTRNLTKKPLLGQEVLAKITRSCEPSLIKDAWHIFQGCRRSPIDRTWCRRKGKAGLHSWPSSWSVQIGHEAKRGHTH